MADLSFLFYFPYFLKRRHFKHHDSFNRLYLDKAERTTITWMRTIVP